MKILTRILSTLFIAAIVLPAYFIRDGAYFHIVLQFGLIMSTIEYTTIISESYCIPTGVGDCLLTALLIIEIGICFSGVAILPVKLVGGCVFVCACTDAGAYLVGSLIGGKVIKKRPFPKTSPKKSYEGLIFGIICGVVATYIWTSILKNSGVDIPFAKLVISVPLSVLGDLMESRFKRTHGVKDANDFLVENRFFKWIEKPLGGRNGHGGYFDRLDSLILVIIIQWIIM